MHWVLMRLKRVGWSIKKGCIMLYIGFSNYSSKRYANIICKKYKHCAPVIINKNEVIIYQFVHINKIVKIVIKKTDIKKLKQHGWIFVKTPTLSRKKFAWCCLTCVQFTKHMCGIKNIKIQTPLALFNYLDKK